MNYELDGRNIKHHYVDYVKKTPNKELALEFKQKEMIRNHKGEEVIFKITNSNNEFVKLETFVIGE